uniref:Uncharacterized protein n=1 Tax=Anguilla anguilla TaxID=7936 RepID=A0A0E9RXV3_ANGAN
MPLHLKVMSCLLHIWLMCCWLQGVLCDVLTCGLFLPV